MVCRYKRQLRTADPLDGRPTRCHCTSPEAYLVLVIESDLNEFCAAGPDLVGDAQGGGGGGQFGQDE